jgi:hypothetical protein
VTEVRKEWDEDPLREDGFLQWASFDANKDALDYFRDKMASSEWLEKIRRLRGISEVEVWKEIEGRGRSKDILVKMREQHDAPRLLEAENTVRAHVKYLLLEEKQREEHGGVDFSQLLGEYEEWVAENLLKPVLAQKQGPQVG